MIIAVIGPNERAFWRWVDHNLAASRQESKWYFERKELHFTNGLCFRYLPAKLESIKGAELTAVIKLDYWFEAWSSSLYDELLTRIR